MSLPSNASTRCNASPPWVAPSRHQWSATACQPVVMPAWASSAMTNGDNPGAMVRTSASAVPQESSSAPGASAPGYLAVRSERPNRVFCANLFVSLAMMNLVILSRHLGLMWVLSIDKYEIVVDYASPPSSIWVSMPIGFLLGISSRIKRSTRPANDVRRG